MQRYFLRIMSCVVACAMFSSSVLGQHRAKIKAGLEDMATRDPEIARALESLTAARTVTDFTESEFLELVGVDWVQYKISPDGRFILGIGASGWGSVGATLGSDLRWTDKDTGEDQFLKYHARSKFIPETGLAVDVTIQINGDPATTTEHVFEQMGSVTVVLKVMPDGSKYVARYVPVLKRKPQTIDYTNNPVLNFKSAILLADDLYVGEFSVRGGIVSISAGKLGLKFQFALKPFLDARAIGRTDGRTIEFDHDDRHYRLVGLEPMTALSGEGVFWDVYIRVEPASGLGNGTSAYGFDAIVIQDAIESLMP